MSKWSTDAETIDKRVFVGRQHPDFDGPLDALAELSRACTADRPQDASTPGWDA